ncbi:MAG: hypothetical protein WC635_12475 [Bacteriovorax sp.]|jgi:hypothetical protein
MESGNSAIVGKGEITEYSQVPKYRRNWFAILMFFVFPPGLIYLLATGDIYYEKKGILKTYSKSAKVFLSIWCCLYILRILLKK